jgi:hypothetical protein
VSKKLSELNKSLIDFIGKQKIFFVATAGIGGRVNVSPKGMDSFHILSPTKVAWLNLTGSGNETAAHVLEQNRITLMFCAFAGKPMILRLYGKAITLHPRDNEWNHYLKMFPKLPGSRQIFIIDIELVITSCGYSVPLFEYVEDRSTLNKWAEKKGEEGVEKYQYDNNQVSIDGKPTNLLG